ncbi:DEAD/DEAH box helicase, partial [Acidovorax sp. HMWF018]
MTTLPLHTAALGTRAVPTPPIGAHAIALPCGTALQLLPQRALWWP